MEPQELSARLRYLNNSAHLLASTAPETSKFLMLQCNALMFDSEIEQSDSRRQQVCGACGSVMKVGWEASVRLETQRPRRKRKGTAKMPERRQEMAYSCAACSRTTRIRAKAIDLRKQAITQKAAPIPTTSQNSTSSLPNGSTSGPHTATLNSKRRAKRKNGGLEALLANKKAADARSSGFGLDLMDFMKKS